MTAATFQKKESLSGEIYFLTERESRDFIRDGTLRGSAFSMPDPRRLPTPRIAAAVFPSLPSSAYNTG
jgi:hypothetical protein